MALLDAESEVAIGRSLKGRLPVALLAEDLLSCRVAQAPKRRDRRPQTLSGKTKVEPLPLPHAKGEVIDIARLEDLAVENGGRAECLSVLAIVVRFLFKHLGLVSHFKLEAQVPAPGQVLVGRLGSGLGQPDFLIQEALTSQPHPVKARRCRRSAPSSRGKDVRDVGAGAKRKPIDVVLVPFEGNVVNAKHVLAGRRDRKKKEGETADGKFNARGIYRGR